MEKAYRIKKNSDFQFIYKKGKSVANRQFVIYTQPNKALNHFRLGISVSKKLGNAVVRNRIKRAIRENCDSEATSKRYGHITNTSEFGTCTQNSKGI